jgi:aromatic ring-opening dioxygenase catalytic subunit (LigB family)
MSRMPTYYIPHGGGPCFFMDWHPPDTWQAMANFLKGIASRLPEPPKAILVVSAHWLAPSFSVTAGDKPELIYDYYGFPAHTYDLQYPAPGNPTLAVRVKHLLEQANLPSVLSANRGFDHGLFIPLMLMFPEAAIPVVQLSLLENLNPKSHWAAGQALQPLRDEGILIVGSGMSFHNMAGYGDPRFGPVSDEFDQWLTSAVESNPRQRDAALLAWENAPSARLCHPPRAEEHLLPLMVVAGAAGEDRGQRVFSDRVMETTISAFRFG